MVWRKWEKRILHVIRDQWWCLRRQHHHRLLLRHRHRTIPNEGWYLVARLRRQIHHHRQRVVAVPMIVVTPTPPHNEIIINRSYKEEGHNVNYYMIVHQLPPRPFCHNIKTTTKKRHGVTLSTSKRERERERESEKRLWPTDYSGHCLPLSCSPPLSFLFRSILLLLFLWW